MLKKYSVFFPETAGLDEKDNNVKTVEITMVFDFTPETTCTRTRRIRNEYVDVELFTTGWLIVFDK